MLHEEYFITGSLRITLLLLNWIFSFTSLELGYVFLKKFREKMKTIKMFQELGYSALFFSLSLMSYFLIIGDFYSPCTITSPFIFWGSGNIRTLFLSFGFISLMTGGLIFTLFMEKYQKYLISKYFFSCCFITLLLVFIIFYFIDINYAPIISILFWPLFLLFFTLYSVDFVKRVEKKRGFYIKLFKMLTTFLLLSIGFLFSTDFMIEMLGLEIRLIGSIFQLISVGLFFIFFIKLPLYSEFDWKDRIEEIFVMSKDGICFYHKTFIKKDELISEQLVTAYIASINIFLKELTSTEGTGTIIKKKGKIVYIFNGKLITGILFCTEEMDSINFYLREFTQKIENIFRNIIIDWNGDPEIFNPVENIANEFFF